MTVASGQMPYEYGTTLPIRALPGAWPGVAVPNISASGDIVEGAMFVLNAELRKWGFTDYGSLQQTLYTHPDITPSGFEPKARGETLTGLVTGSAGIMSVDNIEAMRTLLRSVLFGRYASDSVYSTQDFFEAWVKTAYPESPSGSVVVTFLNPAYSIGGRQFLRPAAEHVTGGDFIDLDLHWLGGSGVLFDIDYGEVIFNPFPFLDANNYFAPGGGDHRFQFSPAIPTMQTTAGAIPSVQAARYQSDLSAGTLRATANFDALASGYIQFDGYVLLPETTIELVEGNDTNFEGTVSFSDDFTGHVQGLRRVNNSENDNTARCYRLPTAQSSGLYRILVHNQKSNVPNTSIPSGFVSLFPEGRVVKADNGVQILGNDIQGQQVTILSDGTFKLVPQNALGMHIFDDTIWVSSVNDSDGSGNLNTRGLFALSPHTGDLVWYRPAELEISSSGTTGPGPATWGAHIGLMDIGTEYVRVNRTYSQFQDVNISGDEDRLTDTVHFERYDQTTLDFNEETSETYQIQSEDALSASFLTLGGAALHGAVYDGSDVYVYTENGSVHKFDTSFNFVTAYRGPIARRRHYGNGQLLYTLGGNVQTGDPLITAGGSSGIGVWTTTDPAGTSVDSVGIVNHISGKPIRGEVHFGHQTSARIHSIFEVAGATHIPNGTWMFIQFGTTLYLCRIVEESTHWQVVLSIQFRDIFDSFSAVSQPDEFPIEGVYNVID